MDATEIYDGEVLRTDFENKRPDPARVVYQDGSTLFYLAAGGKSFVEMWSPAAFYAPWSRVTFEKDGTISLKHRSGYEDPLKEAPWVLELVNKDGSPDESVRVGGETLSVLKGFPIRVSLQLHDPLIYYQRLEWVTIKEKIRDRTTPEYLVWTTRVECRKVLRKKSEIAKIKKLLEEEAVEDARELAARRFKNVVGEE